MCTSIKQQAGKCCTTCTCTCCLYFSFITNNLWICSKMCCNDSLSTVAMGTYNLEVCVNRGFTSSCNTDNSLVSHVIEHVSNPIHCTYMHVHVKCNNILLQHLSRSHAQPYYCSYSYMSHTFDNYVCYENSFSGFMIIMKIHVVHVQQSSN